MNLTLLPNWNEAWKWFSIQGAAGVTVLNTFALTFPHNWAPYVQTATAVLGAMTMYGRLIQQSPENKQP